MNVIDINSVVDIFFKLRWNSSDAVHNEAYAARGVNMWRDWLPENVHRLLIGKHPWEKISVEFGPGELFGKNQPPVKIDRNRFFKVPQTGRFYPKGLLRGLPGVFPQNIEPFRCISLNNGHMEVDLSHPLANHRLNVDMTVGQLTQKETERGGSSADWLGLLTDGPGMQARWSNTPTDFFSDNPFERTDAKADSIFYGSPRLVHHLDQTAREMVTDIYKRFVKADAKVLDLMSSWVSHLPETVRFERVSGLGLNRAELEQNPQLTDIHVHDLNTNPWLPYDDTSFDLVVCTASVEYLIHPLEVVKAVGRVLKPGGTFVVVFSNRWFPPKVIRIWEQLHEFERIGLVMEYFLRSGAFDDVQTYSMRGLPRPRDDKYAHELQFSDPVYAVWGKRKPC
ncbi:methyltransferase, type 11 [Desulfosarcina variabilis str. Montpellier]|uniref:methyltransferase domain-containing protein n=1 Tax=Desulfosarcina variabilis TaxID=2300 RepID=UPI003AFB3249